MNNFCIISYNSRGYDSNKQKFINMLTTISGNELTIICNQENFILKNNNYIVKKSLPDHHIIFNPAEKVGLEGRPINGMYIAVPKSMKEMVKDVTPKQSKRVQGILLTIDMRRFLIINTYFPTDPKTSNFDETELLSTLSNVKQIIDVNTFDQILWAGDINTDFRRNTRYVKIVDDFVQELNLCKSWDDFDMDFTHITERDDKTYTSIIDHFFWNQEAKESITDAGAIYLPDNLSDHSPIYCKVTVDFNQQCNSTPRRPRKPVPVWNKATEEDKKGYYRYIEKNLQYVNLSHAEVLKCKNIKCGDEIHKAEVDEFVKDVLLIIEEAAEKYIPAMSMKNTKKDRIPQWKEEIDPLKETAYFWNAVWISAGKPTNCQLHNVMKRTRNAYHLKIRKNRRVVERLRKDKMLESCIMDNTNLFDQIKKQRNCNKEIASTIDGHTDDIPEYLAEKYGKLYNSVDDENNLEELNHSLNLEIDQSDNEYVNRITHDVLKNCCSKLKPGKTDPIMNITSDFFKNGPTTLYLALASCLKCFIKHAHVSDFLLLSTMVPIIKDKLGDITSSNNYRSIAISSLILKIFDLAIISVFGEFLKFDDLQFGYQTEVSTSMCSWLAVETISYFGRHGSNVYTCLMDMSKAFDTVQHSVLFNTLLDEGMPAIIVRFLLVSYKWQKANVRWGNELSEYFNIGNGVKQGAILSSILYCVYTNGLFRELRRSNIGCSINGNYVGVLGYADDLFLLCPTLDGLQKMLNICERYANSHNLQFSTDPNPQKSKTKCIGFLQKERGLPNLKLCGNNLPWVKTGKHLGTRIDGDTRSILSNDVIEKRARYIQRNNELLQEFSFACGKTKMFINKVYNGSFYGSILWDLYGKESTMLYSTWNVSIRQMLRLDRATHRYLIEPLSGMDHLKNSLIKRFISFTEKMSSSKKGVINNVYPIISSDCRSTTGKNLRKTMLTCNKRRVCDLTSNDAKSIVFQPTPPEEAWRLSFIKELIEIRENKMSTIWDKDEIQSTLDYLCTS